ncbi:MAG: TolC family protein [Treponema sp.]|jgi:outer membrane protein TolC|nr:TolC family protein [Treponema sp.]
MKARTAVLFLGLFFLPCSKGSAADWLPADGLSYSGAARRAVAASDDLRGEYAMQAIREGAWTLGRRAWLPRLTVGASEDDRLAENGADSFVKNYSLSLDQLVWDGGRLLVSRRLERMDLALAETKLERMAEDIADSALSAYRELLYARAVLAIRAATVESLARQRALIEREVELGIALPSDLAEADITLEERRIEQENLKIDLAETEKRFAEILGLEELPPLGETIDTGRKTALPSSPSARSMTEAKNPDLAEERRLIARKQGELKYASLSWMPTVRVTGSFGLSGRRYPLTRQTWSVGINVDFSSPWISGALGGSAGRELPYDTTARIQGSASPLPDPASGMTKRQAELSLSLERRKYVLALERLGRSAEQGVEKCRMADRKRELAGESRELAGERYRLAELRRELGQLTRVELMEERIEYSQKEIAAVEAALALLAAERELEKLMGLAPGELSAFAEAETRGGGS